MKDTYKIIIFILAVVLLFNISCFKRKMIYIYSDKQKNSLESKIYLNRSFDEADIRFGASTYQSGEPNRFVLFDKQTSPLLKDFTIYWIIPSFLTHSMPVALLVDKNQEGYFIDSDKKFSAFLKEKDIEVSSKNKLDIALLSIKLTNTYHYYHITDISQVLHSKLKESFKKMTARHLTQEILKSVKDDLTQNIKPEKIKEPEIISHKNTWKIKDIFFWDWFTRKTHKYEVKINDNIIEVKEKKINPKALELRNPEIGYGKFSIHPNYFVWDWKNLPQLPNNSLVKDPILIDVNGKNK